MRAWRIGRAADIDDLSGAGAARFGGRWNHPDVPALYLSLDLSGCALDTLILAGHIPQLPFKLMHLQLPDDPQLYLQPTPAQLPAGWAALPADKPSMDFGSHWLQSGTQLGLILPSVTEGQTRCLLINPRHPAARQIDVLQIADFCYGKAAVRSSG